MWRWLIITVNMKFTTRRIGPANLCRFSEMLWFSKIYNFWTSNLHNTIFDPTFCLYFCYLIANISKVFFFLKISIFCCFVIWKACFIIVILLDQCYFMFDWIKTSIFLTLFWLRLRIRHIKFKLIDYAGFSTKTPNASRA